MTTSTLTLFCYFQFSPAKCGLLDVADAEVGRAF